VLMYGFKTVIFKHSNVEITGVVSSAVVQKLHAQYEFLSSVL